MRIPLSVPHLGSLESQALQDCIASGWVSSAGPQLREFAERCAALAGRAHAVPVVNGTAALHLALRAIDVGPGDLVLMPALSFIAPANAVCHAGATPIFLDVEAHTWQLDPQQVRDYLHRETEQRKGICYHTASGRQVKALLVVDVLGHLGPMEEYMSIAEEYGLELIEDAAEAIGSSYQGSSAGSFGTVSTFSFNGNKIVTTGGGGMVMTDDPSLAEYVRHLSTQAKSHPTEYTHDEAGFNYRMPSLNAALGLAQLQRLPQFLARKREVFEFYNGAFAQLPQVCPFRPALPGLEPNHWLYTVAAERSRELELHLRGLGIETRKLWQPLPLQQAFGHLHHPPCPVATAAYESSLSLPCSTSITHTELEEVAYAIKEFYQQRA